MRRAILLTLSFLTLTSGLAQSSFQSAAHKRPITAKDLFDFVWIGDTQLSPDAHTVAFVRTTVSPDHSGYQTAVYLLDLTRAGSSPTLLTPGTHDSSPRWSPDGSQIAFLRGAEREGKPAPAQLYVMPATGGSPIRLTDLPKGVSVPQWAPSGTALTVLSSTAQDQPREKLEAALKSRATGDEAHVSDVHIINRANWRVNGEGYLDPTFVPQLYMVYLPKPDGTQDAPWQLTGGRYGVQDYQWRRGSNWLFYTSSHLEEPVYEAFPHNSIFGMDLRPAASHPRELPPAAFTLNLNLEAHGLSISPDGDHLAFHAEAEGAKPISHQQTDLWVLDLKWTKDGPSAPAAPRNLTVAKGYEMGTGVGGDNTAPRGGGHPEILWSRDSSTLLDVAGHQGSAVLLSIDTSSGALTRLTANKQAVLNFAASPDQETIVALVSDPILIGDLFRIGKPGSGDTAREPLGAQTQLTHVNDALFSKLDIAMPQELHVMPTARPGDIPFVTIDTFVELPPGFPMEGEKTGKPSRPYPLILNIHGGPHSAYGWVFDHEMLFMAAEGYVVDYPNPRGSTTYGQNFANIIQNNYPGDDFHDLMDTVDAIISKGWADPNKLGVTGGSGGGLLTDWVVTQTTRFKAAVAQRDITDWANWWYTADVAGFYQSFYPAAPPFEYAELYRAHSPLTFVNKIRTPMMFILGDVDFRTPPGAGGEEFFRALKYKCIPTVMVRFPRESHELSRSGEPWHRIERLDNITNWFDRFLMNKPEPQYDVAPAYAPPCSKPE